MHKRFLVNHCDNIAGLESTGIADAYKQFSNEIESHPEREAYVWRLEAHYTPIPTRVNREVRPLCAVLTYPAHSMRVFETAALAALSLKNGRWRLSHMTDSVQYWKHDFFSDGYAAVTELEIESDD